MDPYLAKTRSATLLLGQAMYFGLSFSKVGYDFRPMLAPIFEKTVIKQFNKIISFEGNFHVNQIYLLLQKIILKLIYQIR